MANQLPVDEILTRMDWHAREGDEGGRSTEECVVPFLHENAAGIWMETWDDGVVVSDVFAIRLWEWVGQPKGSQAGGDGEGLETHVVLLLYLHELLEGRLYTACYMYASRMPLVAG